MSKKNEIKKKQNAGCLGCCSTNQKPPKPPKTTNNKPS